VFWHWISPFFFAVSLKQRRESSESIGLLKNSKKRWRRPYGKYGMYRFEQARTSRIHITQFFSTFPFFLPSPPIFMFRARERKKKMIDGLMADGCETPTSLLVLVAGKIGGFGNGHI